jgi:hypothetical protein
MPLCGECRFGWRRQTVMMLRIPGEQARPVKGAPDLPEGLLPFEATVMRACDGQRFVQPSMSVPERWLGSASRKLRHGPIYGTWRRPSGRAGTT